MTQPNLHRPEDSASFAKYTLGVGGALPVHKHDRTEEFAYILSGDGAAVVLDDDGGEVEVPISAGCVWYNPPRSLARNSQHWSNTPFPRVHHGAK